MALISEIGGILRLIYVVLMLYLLLVSFSQIVLLLTASSIIRDRKLHQVLTLLMVPVRYLNHIQIDIT